MNQLKDRVALVTGAAGGIGKAIVQRLASDDSGYITGQVLSVNGGWVM